MIAVAATVFEIDASGKTVSFVIGCGSSTLRTPNARIVAWPSRNTPRATPGTWCSPIFAVTRSASASNVGSAGASARGARPLAANTARHTAAIANRSLFTTADYMRRLRFVERHWKHTGEPREVLVGREDRHAMALGDSAQEKVGVRALDAARAARVEMLGGALVVRAADLLVRESRPNITRSRTPERISCRIGPTIAARPSSINRCNVATEASEIGARR